VFDACHSLAHPARAPTGRTARALRCG
jgi:hypothetical protein